MRKLRIAQVGILWFPIPPTNYGGIEMMMKMLIDELVNRGHKVTLFATSDCNTKADLHPVLKENFMDLVNKGGANMYEYYANTVVAEAVKSQKHFDVIHYHALAPCIPIISLSSTPGLHTYTNPVHIDDTYVMRSFPKVNVSGISHAQMDAVSKELNRQFPIVYNGLDFEKFSPNFQPGKYVAFLGRMSYVKNPVGAIRIAAAAAIPIILAGEPKNPEEELYFEKEVKPLINGASVKYIGAVNHEEKNAFLSDAAALIFPIQWEEAFGYVMTEAMACGTPVVAYRRGSVPEIIEQGVNGFYAEDTVNINQMAALVKSALALDRKKVRQYAAEKFSLKKMVDDYIKLYMNIIDQN